MQYLLCLLTIVGIVDYPREDLKSVVKWTQAREVNYGYGPVVDDVESYVLDNSHSRNMRNHGDPGNWVHEMTHLINANSRNALQAKYKLRYNSAYILGGYSFSLPEPNVTLGQVAAEVPPGERGGAYKLYLEQQRRYFERESLYVLDEATAAANALCYQVNAEKTDQHRAGLMLEWICYSNALVRAVEKHDPNYAYLDRLKAFVAWHNKRGGFLFEKHRSISNPIVYRLH